METSHRGNLRPRWPETVRMKVFPERDGNLPAGGVSPAYYYFQSEWRSSLKGMETHHAMLYRPSYPSLVRMKVFPERDGNICLNELGLLPCFWSEWRSSLKGMETRLLLVGPNCVSYTVRMKVFPERDGNYLTAEISPARGLSGPNEGLPWKGWKPCTSSYVCCSSFIKSPNEGLPWKGWKHPFKFTK